MYRFFDDSPNYSQDSGGCPYRLSEQAIIDAVRFLCLQVKIVVEPAGALGVAALLSGAIKTDGRVGVILSGGNIDPDVLSEILKPRHSR